MATPCIPWREPTSFVQGDTLNFNRALSNYPGTAGWTLKYEIRGGSQPIEFTSTALATGSDAFSLLVPASTTEGWTPGEYILVGYAVNATGPQQFQFFENSLPITADFTTLPGDAVVTTHYQRMVAALQGVMEGKALHDLKTTRIEMTMIERLTFKEVQEAYAVYYQLRQNEIDGLRAKACLPSRNKIKPRFNITPPGAIADIGGIPWYGGFPYIGGGYQ